MDKSHLVTDIRVGELDEEIFYDRDVIESSINEILGIASSIEQSSEDWMQNLYGYIEASTENYYSSVLNYANENEASLEEDARGMAKTMNVIDQGLEFLSTQRGHKKEDYKERILEIKKKLEEEVIAPLTAEALHYGDFTDELGDVEADYLLRPVNDMYVDQK